ncbi:MAG TPA: alpha/beta fold hydrolase [Gaiellaceae bacterium]|nr:alpha/beta fold hydrolase [Gaiellaceae bacterium]
MVEQRTGFFRFAGHRIAFATVGRGPTVVLPAWWVSNVTSDWQDARFRQFITALATERQVVRYDRLGCGTSDRVRPADTLTLEFEVGTLATLLDHLEIERASFAGGSFGGCTAVRFAAQQPGRVERLALYGSFANGARLVRPAVREAMLELVRSHWGLGSRLLAEIFVPSGDSAERESFARFQRESAGADVAAALLELTLAVDVREEAASLRAPTLVVHRRGDRAIPVAAGTELAALVTHAEVAVLEGDSHMPWFGDVDEVVAALAPFLGIPVGDRKAPRGGEALTPREREVLGLVAKGMSDPEIARRLVVSPHTVHRHVANILRKLDMNSRAAAAAHAARTGIV